MVPLHEVHRAGKFIETESGVEVTRGYREDTGSWCLMGTECPFGKVKSFCGRMVETAAQ